MPKYVQVGSDVVEFPDSMSDTQIAGVIKQQEQNRQRLLSMPYSEVVQGTEGVQVETPAQLTPGQRRGVGVIKGAFVDPIEAAIQLVGGEEARRGVAEREASYQAMRQRLGEEGFEGARLKQALLVHYCNLFQMLLKIWQTLLLQK